MPTEVLPVLPELQSLVPGLRRGQVVAVDGAGLLPLTLLAGASLMGGWCAVIGVPEFGVLAAAGLGVDLDRVVLVREPGEQWAEVLAALLGAVEVVLVRPPARVPGRLARRLTALAHRHRSTLVVTGEWEGAQTQLRVASWLWTGAREGRGYLQGRRVKVEASGRGASAGSRSAWLWLPGPDGTVSRADLEAMPGGQVASELEATG